ncbi:MAG TPA: long-chain fatty acid--CoA ligase [Chromatiales bacterium]|nr:long-chain fatty acid--CoA ligase [Chromatiales bacterium]
MAGLWNEDLISVEEAGTLDGLFRVRVRRSPEREAYRWFDRGAKAWRSLSWAEAARLAGRWQAALAAEGFLEPGDRVAFSLRNGPDWVAVDQAALGLGLVDVPLYCDDRPDNVAFILADSAAKVLVVQDAGAWRRLAPAVAGVESLRRVVVLGEPSGELGDGRARYAAEWLPAEGELRARRGDPHALASIVYTSGTTGRPKGVMLSHHNMLAVAHAALTLVDCYQEDLFLSFLPLSHTLERTGGYYLPMMAGAAVAYARSIPQLAEDLRTVRPTLIVAVPRIFERVYVRLRQQLAKGPAVRRVLFDATVSVGWRRFEHAQGRGRWSPDFLLWPLLDRLVARKVRERLGGRLRAAVSGGAALPLDVARVFIGLGVPILQGYGLTEAAPVVSVNTFDDNDPRSVGIPLPGVEVRIGEDDELLVRGPGVMLGYWNNHAATSAAIDAEGWLHTGDQARIENGHIYITGRLKDIIVLSNGEKVPPVDMEQAICLDPLFDQALVVGEGRPYLAACVVLDAEQWVPFARSLGVDPLDRASLASPKVKRALLRRIGEALHGFPGYAKVRQVHATLEPWTVEDGTLTPTLKLKRGVVCERLAAEIEAMYAAGPA